MREIKFRAWDGLRITLYGIMFNNSTGYMNIISGSILMQYTGLKDKNGKEIYEGDVLKCDDVIEAVTYSDGCFQIILDESAGRSPILQDRTKRFEIIGNIYENPDLLK